MALRQTSDLGIRSKSLASPGGCHLIDRTCINCEFYLELPPDSIQVISRLDDKGTWTAHAVRTLKGSRMRTTVLTATNANSYEEVLIKLHEQSAKDLNAHIRDFGFGLAPRRDDDDDLSDMSGSDDSTLSDSDDEDDKDDSVLNVFYGSRKSRAVGADSGKSPGNSIRPNGPCAPCGTPPCPTVKDEACGEGIKSNAPAQPFRPVRGSDAPPCSVNQPTYSGLSPSSNRPLRKPHSADSMDVPFLAAPVNTASPMGPPLPRAARPIPGAPAVHNAYAPAPPSKNRPPMPFPKPALINVKVNDQPKFTFLDRVVLQRGSIIGAATRAANKRPDVMARIHTLPNTCTLQRVKVGEHEIDLNCPIEDLSTMLKDLTGALGASSEALPCFDVNFLGVGPAQ